IEAIKKLGFEPVVLSNYDKEYAEQNYFGELYQSVYYSGITGDRINLFRSKFKSPVTDVELYSGNQVITAKSVYFKSALKTSQKTNIFIQGDNYEKAVITTSLEDAPKLLIIKGSYANTFVPFLTAHYSQITMIDPQAMAERGETLAQLAFMEDYDQILILCDISEYCSGSIQNIVEK
ncbi:MAG: DHHW family protein, partial [Hominimerdicola sp.]